MNSEQWIKEHLERLRDETADWPEWLKKPMKPVKRSANNLRAQAKSKRRNSP